MLFSVSSTSQIRSAEAAHLGYMTKIMESMVTNHDHDLHDILDDCQDISGITGSVPIPGPRQRSPTTVRFNISIRTVPTATWHASFSWHCSSDPCWLRQTAFLRNPLSQMPDNPDAGSFSRIIRLIRSILVCIFLESGMALLPIRLIINTITGRHGHHKYA